MSRLSSSKISQTDGEKIDASKDGNIDLSDIPEITEEQMSRAVLRVNGEPVERGKQHVSILLDKYIIKYFQTKASTGDNVVEEHGGYQALINEALREYIKNHNLKEDLRHIFREELARSSQNVAQS